MSDYTDFAMLITHNEIYDDITGVLLAGGKSRRMGVDKACIEINGITLFSNSLKLLRQYFKVVMISGNRPDLAVDGLLVIPDIYTGSALGGLFTGLHHAETDWIFVAPCDMPYPDSRILELLVNQRNGFDAVVPQTPHGYEPVFALYHKRCLRHMEEMLQKQQFRIYDFYQRINISYLKWHQMPDGWERALMNINTLDHLALLEGKES